MKHMSNTVKAGLLSLVATMAPLTAVAQDYEDYGDEATDSETPKKRAVREIVKGMYAKTNVGVGMYLGTYSDWLQPGPPFRGVRTRLRPRTCRWRGR